MRYIKLYRIVFLIFASSIPSFSSLYHKINLFDFDKKYSSQCDNNENCYTVEQLVNEGLNFSPESHMQVQQFYQARAEVKIRLGLILPQINFTELLQQE